MKLKNIGRVQVTLNLIYDNTEDFISLFMSKVIVLRAEIYPNKVIDYTIYNKDLREIAEGEEIPKYIVKIENGNLHFEEFK